MANLIFLLAIGLGFVVKNSYSAVVMPKKIATINISAFLSRAKEFKYDGRIVGGTVTSIANYPYQVSLQYHNAHICGGSIVAENIILTAAHCIEQPWDTASFRVRAGSSTHLYGGQLVNVRRIFKHEAYSTSTLDSDVALVVLKENLIFSHMVQPVELATWSEQLPKDDNVFFVSGWGLTSEMGLVVPLLNYAAVSFINQTTCSKNYQYIAQLSPKMFCAGYSQGGKDSCQGDSGGPLVSFASSSTSPSPSPSPSLLSVASRVTVETLPLLKLQTNYMKPKQYGIVSWGVGCAQKNYPGVYANVPMLRPWIDEKLNIIKHL